MKNWNISFGPDVVFGIDARKKLGEQLERFGCKRALLIHDEIMAEFGHVAELVAIAKEKGIELLTYAPEIGEPTPDRVDQAAAYAKTQNIDGLVALGGGATTDITKFVGKILANGGKAEDYLGYTNTTGPKTFRPVIIMPTTAGTGAEITFGLICSNSKGQKRASKHETTVVITDPTYTFQMPKSLTANTGIDAFAHATEVMSNTTAIPHLMADALSKEAVRIAYRWLPVAYEDGENVEARTQMSFAGMLGGYCLRLRKASFGHSIANQVSNRYHYPHGMGVSVGLAPFVRYQAKMNPTWVQMMAEALGFPYEGESTGQKIVEAVDGLLKKVGCRSMKELEIPKEVIEEMVEDIKLDDKWQVVSPEAVPDFEIMKQCMYEAYDF